MLFQSVKMAWNSVVSNKMRSFLTMLGIIIGVVALVVLVSIANGATNQVTDIVSSMGTNMMTVTISDDKGFPLKIGDMEEISDIDHIAIAAPIGTDSMYLTYKSEGSSAQITGTTGDYLEIEGLSLSSGRWLKRADAENHTNVIVINNETALDVLGVNNTFDAVGMEIHVGGTPYTVIGVLEEQESLMKSSSCEGYIPYTTLMRQSSSVSSVTSFVCRADSDEVIDAAEASLTKWLNERLMDDEDAYSIMNMSTIADAMDEVVSAMSIMLGGIAAISLLVGGIGIMNIMLVSVTERTREIGIRKAIGAGEGSILFQFLIEALMLSLLGDMFGVALSWAILQVASTISDMTFPLNKQVVLAATAFSLLIGLIFGMYPARKAARKRPIEALRSV